MKQAQQETTMHYQNMTTAIEVDRMRDAVTGATVRRVAVSGGAA